MNGASQARNCINLCLLLLCRVANPGWVKEYIALRIYKNQCSEESKDPNLICFNEGGTVILLEDSYRTRSTYGPSRTDLTAPNVFNILFETILFLNEALFAQRKRTRLFIFCQSKRRCIFSSILQQLHISLVWETFLSQINHSWSEKSSHGSFFFVAPK